MSKKNSIERRVTRTLLGLTLLLAACYMGLILLFAYITEDEIIDRLLADEIQYLQNSYSVTSGQPTPRLNYMTLYASPEQAPDPVWQELRKSPDTGEIFTADKRHYHVRHLYLSESEQALLVAEVSPLLVVTNLSGSVLAVLIVMIALALALSLWLAYRIARQTTRPIVQLSDEVRQGQQEQKTLALSAAGRSDELGYLADTIQGTYNHLHEALDRESHFTRDVSHELRTPLTVVNNALAMLETRPAKAEDIEALQQAVHHMQNTVSILLALAREESVQAQRFPLRPLVEEVVLTLHRALDSANFRIELSLADSYQLTGNRQLITLLVGNLVENAMRYASQPHLVISLEGDRLSFSNPVAGLVDELAAQPARRQANSPGIGQGLFLVKRITERLNWQLSTQSQTNHFSVTLEISP